MELRTASVTLDWAAARRVSTKRHSIPFINTLRHIFRAEASPTSEPTMEALRPQADKQAWAWRARGPDNAKGLLVPCPEIDPKIEPSTKLSSLKNFAMSCFSAGETELNSTNIP